MSKQRINIVWFKRDLRLSDHEPLKRAIEQAQCDSLKTLLLYVFEPALINNKHYSERHWRFVCESIHDLNQHLVDYNAEIVVRLGHVIDVLEQLADKFRITSVFSHQETGLMTTFERDKACSRWFSEQNIAWHESQTGAVIRGCNTRQDWDRSWKNVMRAPRANPDLSNLQSVVCLSEFKDLPKQWHMPNNSFQLGGRSAADDVVASFFSGRGKSYHRQISKPMESQTACSRLSPYLAWGCISLREFYQLLLCNRGNEGWYRALSALNNRLHWHCHFIQKFETECAMEFAPVNVAYAALDYRDNNECSNDLSAWKMGQTGYPLVDACMRCLHQTGYINFRMRAMLVSFLCHHLNIDWRSGVAHLASLFLDFEPGIHYPQFQMQASVTGINTIRIYNPTKQAIEHDESAAFIKRYCPELCQVPAVQCVEPWRLTPMEQIMYDVEINVDYPAPVVDVKQTYKAAQQRLWAFRKRADVKQEATRILSRHVRQG